MGEAAGQGQKPHDGHRQVSSAATRPGLPRHSQSKPATPTAGVPIEVTLPLELFDQLEKLSRVNSFVVNDRPSVSNVIVFALYEWLYGRARHPPRHWLR